MYRCRSSQVRMIASVPRGRGEGAGREVLEGRRVLLERREPVRLGRVARVAGLGEQREVGEPEPPHERRAPLHLRGAPRLLGGGVPRGREEPRGGRGEEREEAGGGAHATPHPSSARTTSGVISSKVRIRVPWWSLRNSSASARFANGTSSR